MSFGITDTPSGFVVCVMEAEEVPLMLATQPFEYQYQADMARRILQAEQESSLAGQVASALRRAEVFQPLVIESEVRA